MSEITSTTRPGASLGKFHLPLTPHELVFMLHQGMPCEMPVMWVDYAVLMIEQCTKQSAIDITWNDEIAQFTPHAVELNDYGRNLFKTLGYMPCLKSPGPK